MRKILLTAVIALTALNMQAQTWNSPATWSKTLAPVTAADQLDGTKVTIAADGSVIATGTFNQDVTFGSTKLENADQLTSAYIAKYNADGTEAWAVSLFGAAVVKAVDTDAEGNVFVAGNLADAVEFSSVDGNGQTVNGMAGETALVTGYIAKYDKSGNLKAVKTIIPVSDPDVEAMMCHFPLSGDVHFKPQQIKVDGDKLYVSAIYTGDITLDEVKWEGCYVGWEYVFLQDVASVGILSVNASDLGNATSVANFQAKATISDVQQNPESVCFTVADGTVYAGFVGKGTSVLTTAKGAEDIVMERATDESGNQEHAFVLAKITATETVSKVYNVAMHDRLYGTDVVGDMVLDGGNLYIGGTFYGELGFDKTKTSTGSSDVFVANINPETFETNWAVIDGYDEGDVTQKEERFHNMVVYKGNVFVNAVDQTKSNELVKVLNYNIDATGALRGGDAVNYSDISVPQNDVIATVVNDGVNTTVSVFGATADGIESVEGDVQPASDKIYNIMGQPVQNLTKGLYIIGGKKVVVK